MVDGFQIGGLEYEDSDAHLLKLCRHLWHALDAEDQIGIEGHDLLYVYFHEIAHLLDDFGIPRVITEPGDTHRPVTQPQREEDRFIGREQGRRYASLPWPPVPPVRESQ